MDYLTNLILLDNMTNDIIKPHKFEVAKNKIQKLAHNVPSTVSMERFQTEGSIFSWNNHNITGEEANRLLVSPLQSTLIAQNENIRSLFNIADEVYKALESLDKEYISGIITSVEAAKMASNQAKAASSKAEQASSQALDASQKALEASISANNAQTDIKKTIEGLKMTIQILKEFKEKVTLELAEISPLNKLTNSIKNRVQNIEQEEIKTRGKVQLLENNIQSIDSKIIVISELSKVIKSILHLSDVDAIWNDVQAHKAELVEFHQQVDTFIDEVNKTTNRIHNDIAILQQYRSVLESYRHISDVDTIWNDVETHKIELANFHRQVNTFIENVNQTTDRIYIDIAALQQYRSMLESYKHLGNVDSIWNDVEAHKTELADFHRQVDNFISEVKNTHSEIRESILKCEEANACAHIRYEKRIKTAYYIGGTALGLSIINYVLTLMGIL